MTFYVNFRIGTFKVDQMAMHTPDQQPHVQGILAPLCRREPHFNKVKMAPRWRHYQHRAGGDPVPRQV